MSQVPYIGVLPAPAECIVPPGAKIVQLKYCEFCGKSFPRKFVPTVPREQLEADGEAGFSRAHQAHYGKSELHIRLYDAGQRICFDCARKPAPELRAEELLKDQEVYREQLPNLDSLHLSSHPIKYDRSVVGRETSAHRNAQKTGSKPGYNRNAILLRADKTRALVTAAFREKNRLSMEELQAIIPECYAASQIYMRLHGLSIQTRLVAYSRKPGIRGKGMGIYVLDGVSPETLH